MSKVNYKALANRIRVQTLRMVHRAKSSHIGGCLSAVDLLTVLYGSILYFDASCPDWEGRDRLIVSKGHIAGAVYTTLAEMGYFPKTWLETFCKDGSRLPGHITTGVPGVEVSTGSLGHGLPIGCGMALASKHRVFVLLSDGECDEGSTWEAALFASHHHLDNLTAIVDYNKIQAFGTTSKVLDLEPFCDKWHSFGWAVCEVDGHNYNQIELALLNIPIEPEKPSCIIAHTIKGKGVSFMEHNLLWHYKPPNDDELHQALVELEAK